MLWTTSEVKTWLTHQDKISQLKGQLKDKNALQNDPIDDSSPPKLGCLIQFTEFVKHNVTLLLIPIAIIFAFRMSPLVQTAYLQFIGDSDPIINPGPQGCFFDDFDDPASGWTILDNSEATYGYSSGEYSILSKPEVARILFSVSPFGVFDKYNVKVDTKWSEVSSGDYGIMFGMREDTNNRVTSMYRFAVTTEPNPNFSLTRFDGNRNIWSRIIEPTVTPLINEGTQTNSLAVTCSRSQVELYINNNLIFKEVLPEDCAGAVALFTSSTPQEISKVSEVRFDNFEICTE